MRSAAYASRSCSACRPVQYVSGKYKSQLYASVEVRIWVIARVQRSSIIWDLSKGCYGCCEVHEDAIRVLANLLWKVGVGVAIREVSEGTRGRI